MASNSEIVIAFDLYGTLLSTESIAKELATHFGDEKAQSIAALWRRYVSLNLFCQMEANYYLFRFQLEYTWRMNSMGGFFSLDDVLLPNSQDQVLNY